MKKSEVREAAPLLARTVLKLQTEVQSHGREGADVRRAVGNLIANGPQLLRDDEAGAPIADCFDAARLAGVTTTGFTKVISLTASESPVTLGAALTKHCLIGFGLTELSRVLADTTFESRQDVEQVRAAINDMFSVAEEVTADEMDSETYRLLVNLHAAVSFHLIATERPLPRMIRFHFARPLPTIVAAYRLYDDASRGDMLRAENKVVHPAFMRNDGLALSA